jgi:predicted porin
MKKSLIALAILGSVAGAAQAQSAVTLYGIVDLWTGRVAVTDAAGVKTSETLMESGGVSGSRWGLKGEEDLGGGLKAVFKIESGFAADTGVGGSNASPKSGPNRQTYLGLAGGFGEVTFGNVYSAMDDVLGASNSGFDSALSASQNVLVVPASYNDKPKNAFKYVSPNFGGFSGGFSYSLDENPGKTNQTDFSLSYGAGPIAANFAYEIQGDAAGTEDLKLTALNGSYDLGMAKLLASYGQAKLGAFKSTDFQIGADVPVSSALTVSVGYAQSKDNAALGDGKRTGFGVAAAYSLSKRTTAYGGFRQAKVKDASDKVTVMAVGLKHTF